MASGWNNGSFHIVSDKLQQTLRHRPGGQLAADCEHRTVVVRAIHGAEVDGCNNPNRRLIVKRYRGEEMGLYVHSLGEIPAEVHRSYYLYLLDYGWDEPFGEAVRSNIRQMSDAASKSDAVFIYGPRGLHFEDEVLSWHHVNREPAEELLPAIMVTTRNPTTFKESLNPSGKLHSDALLLIPLKKTCKTPDAVVAMIAKLFDDIKAKKQLTGFQVTREMKSGKGGALVNALILEPNFSGIGINLKKLARLFKKSV